MSALVCTLILPLFFLPPHHDVMPVWAVRTITGGRFFGCSNQKSVSPIPNYAGGITIVQLGAEVRNDRGGRLVHTASIRVNISADKCIQRAYKK